MLNLWMTSTRPPVLFWLAAFTFPTALLTAVLQQTARQTGISVDVLSWDFRIIESDCNMIEKPDVSRIPEYVRQGWENGLEVLNSKVFSFSLSFF